MNCIIPKVPGCPTWVLSDFAVCFSDNSDPQSSVQREICHIGIHLGANINKGCVPNLQFCFALQNFPLAASASKFKAHFDDRVACPNCMRQYALCEPRYLLQVKSRKYAIQNAPRASPSPEKLARSCHIVPC